MTGEQAKSICKLGIEAVCAVGSFTTDDSKLQKDIDYWKEIGKSLIDGADYAIRKYQQYISN